MISHTLQRSASIRWCAEWASSLITKKMNFLTYLFSSLNPKLHIWTPRPFTVLSSPVKLSLYHVLRNDGRDLINLTMARPIFYFTPILCCVQKYSKCRYEPFIKAQAVIVLFLWCLNWSAQHWLSQRDFHTSICEYNLDSVTLILTVIYEASNENAKR